MFDFGNRCVLQLLTQLLIGFLSLKETENLLNNLCKINIYFTRDHRKSYLTPTFNTYPLCLQKKIIK